VRAATLLVEDFIRTYGIGDEELKEEIKNL